MSQKSKSRFHGYNHFVAGRQEFIPTSLPKRIKVTDAQKFFAVDLNYMSLPSDAGGQVGIRLRDKSKSLANATQEIFFYVALHALNGNRKVSTVMRWLSEFCLFTMYIRKYTAGPISTITFAMFNWHASAKSGSQQKLLRSMLKYWVELNVPGIEPELKNFLLISRAPKARGTIEIQNSVKHERPFSFAQVREILSKINDLYIGGQFNPQENLLWRLIASEGMRPSQIQLLQIGDVTIECDDNGKVAQIHLSVPIVKQKATPARRYMMAYRLSESVGRALCEHLSFLEDLLGQKPRADQPLFSVVRKKGALVVQGLPVNVVGKIIRTRPYITREINDFENNDLLTRRFKHTKLTHLAMLGAPLGVLARSGFQTSTISLRHYVNLTEEAFCHYEELLTRQHSEILVAFKGEVVNREDCTNPDRHHLVLDTSLESDVGSCATDPCNAFAPVACYVCPRFEAFSDGPHEVVLSFLLEKKERALRMKLSTEALKRDDHLVAAVQNVIDEIKRRRTNGAK